MLTDCPENSYTAGRSEGTDFGQSLRPVTMSTRFLCLLLPCMCCLLPALAPAKDRESRATRVQTTVYRCERGAGFAPAFQSSPCLANQVGLRMQLQHVQPAQPAAAAGSRRRAESEPAARERRTTRGPAANARRPAAPENAAAERPWLTRKSRSARAKAGQSTCPASREDGGTTGSNSVGTAWKRYQSLPSRTYLKNAGKWPRHCPD